MLEALGYLVCAILALLAMAWLASLMESKDMPRCRYCGKQTEKGICDTCISRFN